MSYTYVILEISPKAYSEIADKLREANYHQAFHVDGSQIVIDMHGIAVANSYVPYEPEKIPGEDNNE